MVYTKGRVQVRSAKQRAKPFIATVIVEKPKRKTSDIKFSVDTKEDRRELFAELEKDALSTNWDYKENIEFLQSRDHALVSLLALTGLRIQEALMLKAKQFKIRRDRIRLISAKTLKRGMERSNITLPKKGALAPLTFIFEEWLLQVPNPECYIFPSARFGVQWDTPLGTTRAFWIIKATTGKFPHWYRAVCETVYGKLVYHNDPWKLKKFMGLQRLESTVPYVSTEGKEAETLFKL